MLYEDGDEVPDFPGIQRTVLLLDNLLDDVPAHFWKLFGEPVNHDCQRPQLFTNSHRESVSHWINKIKA